MGAMLAMLVLAGQALDTAPGTECRVAGGDAPLRGAAPSQGQDGRDATAAKLETLRVSVDFRETPIEDAMEFLRQHGGLNIVVSPRVHESRPDARVTLKLRHVSLKSALKIALGSLDLGATFRDGAIVVVPKEELRGAAVVRVYDVRDILLRLQDFPGPKVELAVKDSGIKPIIDIDEPKTAVPEDFLLEMLRASTGGGSWEEGASVAVVNGLLVVTQTKAVHGEIGRFLDLMRQFK
ncbi:MAG: hypothetical protein HYY17_15830 [Planctomycetes bacterium]|nr:hypothetical protein [Planctomycetota bacterium]